ncbi:glycosyltransferase family A protein [Leifsonia kafniensis]|uniref:4,4'-diaponeurosporenoate glycosyltransferase n=1 Tax=Leifsonia kafniensis TaxID=475957 RepID=A0ABP7KQ93_9MICO
MNNSPLEAIVVVIPVHNEEALLARCLSAMEQAISSARSLNGTAPEITVQVVLDACTDDSELIASAFPYDSIGVDFTNVGQARALGVQRGIRRCAAAEPRSVWIANTDADSTVPPNWISAQIELAQRGVDLMVGTVRPDFADLDEPQRDAWTRTHTPGHANGHVHGANLGFRAHSYLQAGGFLALPEHEDVQLVSALRALPGLVEVATDECWVLTSGRGVGRTPGGYAGYLATGLVASAPQ